MQNFDIIAIGGGAVGFFAAINAAILNPTLKIAILEQGNDVLSKVRVSGGGRCNLTHDCHDPKLLIKYYPRGHKELLGPFYNFGPEDTRQWFDDHGVPTKVEEDGRVFPTSNTSESIISCFMTLCEQYHIEVKTSQKVVDISMSKPYVVTTKKDVFTCQYLVIATGSVPSMWSLLQSKGYDIIEPVPSLFTFQMHDHPICALQGLSVKDVSIKIPEAGIQTEGALLVTHWGVSGPVILKASAWGAVPLAKLDYQFEMEVDWIPKIQMQEIEQLRNTASKKIVATSSPYAAIPLRLWKFLMDYAQIPPIKNYASLTKGEMQTIVTVLKKCPFRVDGKATFKAEFVTAGGVALSQINFKTFESKRHENVYFAGEVLNIDAVTGGFNFQAAWTGAYHIAQSIVSKFGNEKTNY